MRTCGAVHSHNRPSLPNPPLETQDCNACLFYLSESALDVLDVVAIYKELSDVEQGFRQFKDVLAVRPIYHQVETRVKAHIFVAAPGPVGPAATSSPAPTSGD